MGRNLRFAAMMAAAIGMTACGGGAGTKPITIAPTSPTPSTASTHQKEEAGTIESDAPVAVELSTIMVVTTNADELITFVEHAMSPEHLPASAQSSLRGPRPANATQRTKVEMPNGSFTCFAQRTPSDDRAMVIRKSKEGFLVAPIPWMAEAIRLPGAKEDDARVWYMAMSRRIATAGHATGLVRFTNGNAIKVSVDLRAIEPNDAELVAVSHFLKAGEYKPNDGEAILEGADSVETQKMNKHDGVSVFDLLRKLHSDTKPASSTST